MKEQREKISSDAAGSDSQVENARVSLPQSKDIWLNSRGMALEALLEQANEANWHEDLGAALRGFDAAIEGYQCLIKEGESQWRGHLANAWQGRGSVLTQCGDLPAAEASCQNAIEVYQAVILEGDLRWRGHLASAQQGLGAALLFCGEYSRALAEFDTALHGFQVLLREGDVQWQGDWALARSTHAQAQRLLGNWVAGLAEGGEAIEGFQAAIELGLRRWRSNLAREYFIRADLLEHQGDLPGALDAHDKAIEGFMTLINEGENQWHGGLAQAQSALAETLRESGLMTAALEKYDAAIKIFEEQLQKGEDHWRGYLAQIHMGRAATLAVLGDVVAAMEDSDAAISGFHALIRHGETRWRLDLAKAWEGRAMILSKLQSHTEALIWLRHAIEDYRQLALTDRTESIRLLHTAQQKQYLLLSKLSNLDPAELAQDYFDFIARAQVCIANGEAWWAGELLRVLDDRTLLNLNQGLWAEGFADMGQLLDLALSAQLPFSVEQLLTYSLLGHDCIQKMPGLAPQAPRRYRQIQSLLEAYLESDPAFSREEESQLLALWGVWLDHFQATGAMELVAEISAHAHARHAQALVLLDIETQGRQLSPTQADYLEVRRALIQVRGQLTFFCAPRDHETQAVPLPEGLGEALPDRPALFEQLQGRHEFLRQECRRLKTKLSQDEPLFQRLARLDLGRLREELGAHQALALWVSPAEYHVHQSTPFLVLIHAQGCESLITLSREQLRRFHGHETALILSQRGRGVRSSGHALLTESTTPAPSLIGRLASLVGSFGRRRLSGPVPQTAPQQDLLKELEQTLWAPLARRCATLGIDELHLITSGELHSMPWQGSAPDTLALSVFPGLFAYVKRTLAPAEVCPTPAYPLLVLAHDAAGDPQRQLYALPLEVSILETLWGKEAVRTVAELPETSVNYAGLLCLGHGQFDTESGQAYLMLKAPNRLDQTVLAQDQNCFPRLEASACVLGRLHDRGNEPCGLIATAMNRSRTYGALGALLPINDILAGLRTLIAHIHWKNGLTAGDAARRALKDLECATWPPEASGVLEQALIQTLPGLALSLKAAHGEAMNHEAGETIRARLRDYEGDYQLKGSTAWPHARRLWQDVLHHGDESLQIAPLAHLLSQNWPTYFAQAPDIKTFTRFWLIC